MEVDLKPDVESYVKAQLEGGRFASVSDLVNEAVREFQSHEELDRIPTEELRRKVAVGLDASARGEVLDAEEVFARLEERNRAAANRPQ